MATTITSVLQNAQYMKTANLTVETFGNDTIGTAVPTGLTGGADIFVADGEIGDNPNLIIQGLDVDMVHLNLNAGDSIQVTARPHIDTPLFDPLVRIFDVAGNELAVNDNAMGLTAQTGVSVNLPGTYYVAVSASPNDNYDSVVAGFGTVGATTGMYELEIMVNGFGGIVPRQVGSRVQLDGAVKISQSANSSIVLDGLAGVERGRVAFDVHANMTNAEVSQVVQQVLADEFAGGYLLAFPYHEQYVRISRHDIVERGPFGLDEELPTDAFGSFHGPGALGAADNLHEGVYIDDIIIGFAERGEMVVGGGLAPADRGQFVNNTTAPPNPVILGEYQLELRRAQEFVEPSEDDLTSFVLVDSFDTNDRVSQEHSLVAPSASDVVDGQIFTISDGVDTVTFEFEDVSLGNGIQPGRQEISFNPSADDGRGGLTAEDQSTMARRIRDAINSTQVQAVLDVTAAMSDGEVNGEESTSAIVNLFGTVVIGQPANITDVQVDLSLVSEPNDTQSGAVDTNLPAGQNSHVVGSGQIGDNPLLGGFNAPLDVDIVRFDLQAGSEATFRIHAAATGSDLDSTLRLFDESGNELAINDNIDLFNLDSEIVFTATSSGTYFLGISATGNETYTIDSLASGKVGLTTGEYELEVDVVSAGVGFLRFDAVGDENVVRDQGQVIISSSQISHSLEFGVVVDAGARDPLNAPHPGVARNLSQINSERLVPGAVIKNNIISFNQLGGISFSGQTTAPGQPDAVVPFGRIVNNTLYGVGGSLSLPQSLDVGINISDNASPTLLNNIFANFNAGIAVDASSASTVIGGSVYQGNNDDSTVGLGARPIQLSDVAPLFLDALNGNFYPAPGSQVIDSSMESLEDRLSMVSVRGPLGIPVSPIIAPEFDVLGQLRADDPLVEGGNGAGQNVFIDRGAVDRSDFAGPTAFLIEPRDNDANGVDQDPQLTVVDLTAQSLEAFAIQLVDGVEPVDPANGVGVDDRTIQTEQVKVFQDSILLVDGVDYRFRYDSLNNTIRIIPLAGVWESNHTYRIQIANDDQFLIVAPAGDEVSDGQAFTMVDNDSNFARFEYESGYVLTVPETFVLNMPRTGGGLGGVTDRENFALNGTTFEFDNNGSVATGSESIVFTPTDNADVLAQAVVDAILLADIGLAPKFIGDGAIHLGTQLTDVVSLINAPSLSSRGTVGGGLRDGDTIRIDDGSVDQVFQIGIGGIGGGGIGTTVISILQSDTYEEVADKVVAAITAATNLTPTHLGTGVIQVGGSLRTVIDASGSQMTQAGQPGVAASFGILIPTIAGVPQNISDGDTFQVGDGVGLPITFEFDSDNVVVPGNTVVRIPSNNPTMDRIANAMVQAIASVGLGVSPVNVGDGRVELQNATINHFFSPLTSSLTQLGSPGVDGSLPIPFVPADTFTSIDMAVVIETAINASKLIVDATRVDDQITLEGISNVAGVVESFVQGVRDLAGNLLKPNQPLDTTEFTILLGSGLDYGDAPVTYDTLTVDGGPSHTVIPGYGLGAEVDVDVDGQPNATATGDDTVGVDDEDGVVFGTTIRGFDGTVTVTTMGVTAAQQGRLDAWIDFNHDGDFVDAGEQVFTSEVLADGLNSLTYAIPSAATVGDTFARFRLSSTGGLTPFGTAIDGEVEDLGVTINSSPWQNGIKIADVTGDGRVQPLDVLHIVSFLSRFGPQDLPVPPPFIGSGGEQIFADQRMIDVDGNGRVQVLDAVLVVNAIFLQNQGGGEGESTRSEERR
ncbi:MAG: GEVED domain-containing protein, partial [Pirellulaceae bacterium]